MDFEQRYNDALERAKEKYSACSAPALLEYIFPELKESEEEKIKRELRNDLILYVPTPERYIAWLEKQGHMLDPDKVVEWLKTNVFDDSAYGKAMIDKFKEDIGL